MHILQAPHHLCLTRNFCNPSTDPLTTMGLACSTVGGTGILSRKPHIVPIWQHSRLSGASNPSPTGSQPKLRFSISTLSEPTTYPPFLSAASTLLSPFLIPSISGP